MKEDDQMALMSALRSQERARVDGEADTTELSTIPTEALARLDRIASASVLAAGLAHEVANPLSVLLGALDGIERRVRELRSRGTMVGAVDALSAELELASASTTAITDVIHDFQLFLRSQDPNIPSGSRADVREAVQRAVRIAEHRLESVARVEVQLRDVPAVRGSAGRIVQVVLNLLLNAAEALASRSQSQNLVAVRLDVAAGRVLIEVSDNGPGLPSSVRERLFEPGVGQRAGRPSSGLGLAISRELVRKMQGEIAVSSLPGAGTTFIVSLPVAGV